MISRRVTAIGVVLLLVACGGKGKGAVSANAEVSADTDDDLPDPSPSTGTPPPPTAAVPPPALTAAAVAPPANCPIACTMLGPAGRELAADDVSTLRSSLASTVASLHGCIGDTGGRYVRAPALVARFAESGELLDMGVDSDGWSRGEQACFDGVVHGGTQPQVTMQGRATVRCSETCGSHHGRRGHGDDPIYSNNVLQAGGAPAPTATQPTRAPRMGGGRGGGRGGRGGGGTQ